jgi:hypothetical protein
MVKENVGSNPKGTTFKKKKKKGFSFFLWRPYSLQKDYQEAKE